MKKIGLLTLCIALSLAGMAQDQDNKKMPSYISIGPTVGVGHSWVSSEPNMNFKPSVEAGVSVLYSRYNHWGFGGIVSVSHEGYSTDVYKLNNWYTNTFDPVYLRVTPRAYYFFGQYGNAVRPKVYAGPSLGIIVSEDKYINEPGPIETSNNVPISANVFNTVDFGANVGAGVNIQLYKRTWLNVDADYYHGFTNATIRGNKNRRVRGNVGLLFGI